MSKNLIVVRSPLTDLQKISMIEQYSKGIPVETIALSVSREPHEVTKFIDTTINNMETIRETNLLTLGKPVYNITKKHPTKFITDDFLSLIDSNSEAYAYYFAQTGDNKFSLQQSGFDIGIPQNLSKVTKDYLFKIRGQFLRDIPYVKQYIKEDQDRKIAEYRVEKPQIQMDLVGQIEELKEVVVDDPRQRPNLLKAIEMLGRTIGAFTDRVEVEETDAKSGLEIILERAKREAAGTYTIEDV